MSNIVDAVEDRFENAILTVVDSIVVPKIELAIRSKNASSERDATSVTANSERGEPIGITVPFENAFENNNVLHISNVIDETRNIIPGEVVESSVPETRFDRQSHTHPIRSLDSFFRCVFNTAVPYAFRAISFALDSRIG